MEKKNRRQRMGRELGSRRGQGPHKTVPKKERNETGIGVPRRRGVKPRNLERRISGHGWAWDETNKSHEGLPTLRSHEGTGLGGNGRGEGLMRERIRGETKVRWRKKKVQ